MNVKNDVLISESGWLFLHSGRHAPFDYYTGRKKLSDEAVHAFNSNIEDRSEFCAANGIPYLHVVFPGKPICKSEYLPDGLGRMRPIFSDELKHPSVMFPYLELEQGEASFFATDTHTSHEGSWSILGLLLRYLAFDLQVTPRFGRAEVLGDLSKMIGATGKEEFNRFEGVSEYEYAGFETGNRSALSGNSGEIRIFRNALAPLRKRILIFGDSFFNDILNLQLSHLFGEVIYFRNSFFTKPNLS